jgi:flagellar motor switch protein FliN/FliY
MTNPERAPTENAAPDRRDSSSVNSFRRSVYGVPVTITVSIGQKRLSVSEILELQPESIIPLAAKIDDPVDLSIGNKLIARGELVETGDGQIAVKIIEIIERATGDNG